MEIFEVSFQPESYHLPKITVQVSAETEIDALLIGKEKINEITTDKATGTFEVVAKIIF